MEERIEATAASKWSASSAPKLSATSVADVMTTKLTTLSPHYTFGEAVQLMANSPFRHFLVINADRTLAGVFSDRDVLRALGRTPNWQAKAVSGVMTCYVVTVNPKTPLSIAAKLMLERRINCLPVVEDDGKVCGILTSTDLLSIYQKMQASLEATQSGTAI
jgi:CBS domain-containing membrane protein